MAQLEENGIQPAVAHGQIKKCDLESKPSSWNANSVSFAHSFCKRLRLSFSHLLFFWILNLIRNRAYTFLLYILLALRLMRFLRVWLWWRKFASENPRHIHHLPFSIRFIFDHQNRFDWTCNEAISIGDAYFGNWSNLLWLAFGEVNGCIDQEKFMISCFHWLPKRVNTLQQTLKYYRYRSVNPLNSIEEARFQYKMVCKKMDGKFWSAKEFASFEPFMRVFTICCV